MIVGAGPTGLMAATLLRRSGVSVRVFDKSAQHAHESRAFAVHARSLELMRTIGLGDAFMERGLVATGVQVFVDGRQVSEIDVADLGRTDTPYPVVLMVPQWDIEAILAEDLRAHGVTVEHELEVTDFRQTETGRRARHARRSDALRGAHLCTDCHALDGPCPRALGEGLGAREIPPRVSPTSRRISRRRSSWVR